MLKEVTTSKLLTYIMTFAYVVQMAIVGYVKGKYNIDLTDLLNYATPVEFTIICAYFGKSSMENKIKIQKDVTNCLQKTIQPEDLTNKLSAITNMSNQVFAAIQEINEIMNQNQNSNSATTSPIIQNNQTQQREFADPSDMYKNH